MTATLPPPAPTPPAPAPPPPTPTGTAGQPNAWTTPSTAPRRTLLALLAGALGIMPLRALLSDNGWLVDAWLTMAVVIGPAVLIRLRRTPSALDVWPGIVLLIPWLTLLFVPHHAWGGLIPNTGTFHDVSHLMSDLHRTTRDEVAPISSTVAVRLVVCALVGLLAALIDLIAVVGRRGALAGVPLLVVFTVSGAVPRSPVAWGWFILAAIGFLLLLGLDADDELRDWGRRISRRGAGRTRPGVGISAQRIGVVAVLVAVLIPALTPDHPRNLLADAFHNSNGDGIGGFGAGSGSGGSISPFVALKGQLDRNNPVTLAKVHVAGPAGAVPFYLKTNVLDRYTDDVGWSVSSHGPTQRIEDTDFGSMVDGSAEKKVRFTADIKVLRLSGNTPVFTSPVSVDNVAEGTTWSPQDGILLGASVAKDQTYTETFDQPEPTLAELRTLPRVADGQLARWLQLPDDLPKYVINLVNRIVQDKTTPYDKARALSDYFADPDNNFFYSLKTKPGDSGSALVDFLQQKEGFCQQYAAALAVMLRVASVPSRVVLGYMHVTPDRAGNFDISTLDAHAWVEAYFPGAGWVPFDPTPAAGLSGGRDSDLPWAPHQFPKSGSDTRPRESSSAPRPARSSTSAAPLPDAPAASAGTGSTAGPLWFGLGVLVVAGLVLIPAGVRATRRRRRYLAARRGDTDALWRELSDTAVDLGYVWSSARSPRQVSAWLARDAGPTAPALAGLAAAVEQQRYAPAGTSRRADGLVRGLQEVTGELRSRRSRRLRIRALLWPASLGWTARLRRWGRPPRHR
jgi:transglutaminase-like putative cysteine protease